MIVTIEYFFWGNHGVLGKSISIVPDRRALAALSLPDRHLV